LLRDLPDRPSHGSIVVVNTGWTGRRKITATAARTLWPLQGGTRALLTPRALKRLGLRERRFTATTAYSALAGCDLAARRRNRISRSDHDWKDKGPSSTRDRACGSACSRRNLCQVRGPGSDGRRRAAAPEVKLAAEVEARKKTSFQRTSALGPGVRRRPLLILWAAEDTHQPKNQTKKKETKALTPRINLTPSGFQTSRHPRPTSAVEAYGILSGTL